MFKAYLFFIILANSLMSLGSDYVTEFIYLRDFKEKRLPVVVLDTGINFKDNKIIFCLKKQQNCII